jgi:hypothetical protein
MTTVKRECMVMLLPTEKAENCFYLNGSNKLNYHRGYLTQEYLKNNLNAISYHLYILSNDEIKEGDWCILLDDFGKVFSNPQQYLGEKAGHTLNNGLIKIIAATDTLLKSAVLRNWMGKIDTQSLQDSINSALPQPSPQFIEAYVRKYSKREVIERVMVDYEIPDCSDDLSKEDWDKYYSIWEESDAYKQGYEDDICSWSFNEGKEYLQLFAKPKVDKNNYITITKMKDSWSREEVKELLKDWGLMVLIDHKADLDNFVKQNL